jgi:hypothetical protein
LATGSAGLQPATTSMATPSNNKTYNIPYLKDLLKMTKNLAV